MDLGAPNDLGSSFDHIGKTERRHEKRDRRLVDKGSEYCSLNQDAKRRHRCESQGESGGEGDAAFDQAYEGQSCKEQQRSLREIEDSRGLVDEHEPDRD